MNRIACLLLLTLLCSCNYFEKKKLNSEDILKEELQTFNWNDVDTYPTFDNCDASASKEMIKACFQNTILSSVNAYLNNQYIVVNEDVNDTIKLQLIVEKTGVLKVEQITLKPETEFQIPYIDSLLRESIKGIPKIYPAIKRGQQVTTEFELPIIVKID